MSATKQPEPERAIAVSIVEDDSRVRESFAALLNHTPGLRCLNTYATGEESLGDIPQAMPDVVLMDIHLPGMSGIECVDQLTGLLPDLKILMLTRYEHSDLILQALRAGASGYLLKSLTPAELIEAVRQAHAGGAPMSMQIARKVIAFFQGRDQPPSAPESLTPREREILKWLSQGFAYREIAENLGIALFAVHADVHLIYKKLHVHSRGRALAKFDNQFGPTQIQPPQG